MKTTVAIYIVSGPDMHMSRVVGSDPNPGRRANHCFGLHAVVFAVKKRSRLDAGDRGEPSIDTWRTAVLGPYWIPIALRGG